MLFLNGIRFVSQKTSQLPTSLLVGEWNLESVEALCRVKHGHLEPSLLLETTTCQLSTTKSTVKSLKSRWKSLSAHGPTNVSHSKASISRCQPKTFLIAAQTLTISRSFPALREVSTFFNRLLHQRQSNTFPALATKLSTGFRTPTVS